MGMVHRSSMGRDDLECCTVDIMFGGLNVGHNRSTSRRFMYGTSRYCHFPVRPKEPLSDRSAGGA
jgi:hypothetical protein